MADKKKDDDKKSKNQEKGKESDNESQEQKMAISKESDNEQNLKADHNGAYTEESGAQSGEELDGASIQKNWISELEEENSYLKDQLLRKQADYENFRKRLFKEKEESIKYANQMLLLDITSIIDNFEMAMKSAEESKDFDAFHKGVILIEKQLVTMLENKWALKRFDSNGKVFDPEKHLAIDMDYSDEYEVPTVVEDYQKGYFLGERVLRPAKVKVAKPKTENDKDTEQNISNNENE